MFDRTTMIKTFAEIGFQILDRKMEDLSEKEIDWKPVKEANSLRWILTHLSQQWNAGIYRILKGDPEYKPEGWPENYVGNESYFFSKIVSDMDKGRKNFISELEKLTPQDLDAEIPLWSGVKNTRQYGLLLYVSEIFHHSGQIAYIRGAINRRRQTDDHFLT